VTSSVSARSRSIRHVDVRLYALLVASAAIGLGRSLWRYFARSSPRILQSEGTVYLSGHPVAQAPPGRAAPAWSSWSTPRLNELDQAGAVWLPPGVRWIPAGLRHPRAAGSRAGSPAAGGIFRVQGRRSCPPEAASRRRSATLVRARATETPGVRRPIARLCSTGIAAALRLRPRPPDQSRRFSS
jgi:hypothetical protein